jgi:hypothetical protein
VKDRTLDRLKKDPAFKALEAVYRALLPLDGEKRRRVIEAVHTLLKISEGKNKKGKR